MGKSTNTGHRECTGCKGQNIYVSEEVSGAMAVPINTPGPVDLTFMKTILFKVKRCSDCGEKVIWILSPEAFAAERRKQGSQMVWIGYLGGVAFAGTALYLWLTWPYEFELTIILLIGASALLSLIFFSVGYSGSQMKKAYLRQDQGK